MKEFAFGCRLSKSILVLPIFFLFALFALGIPLYVIQDAPKESFGIEIILFACLMFIFESLAECLSVWIEDPIQGKIRCHFSRYLLDSIFHSRRLFLRLYHVVTDNTRHYLDDRYAAVHELLVWSFSLWRLLDSV